MMTCAPHGNVARHSKDTSTCTLLYLETSGFRGGASGWGFGVGFRGFGVGFRGGVVMPCAQRGNVARYSKDTSTHTPLFGDFRVLGQGFGVGFRGWVSRFRAGVSGWGRDAVRSAWKRGTPQQGLCQWPWNVKPTLKTNLECLGENGLLSTTLSLQLFCTTKYLLRNASELYNYASVHGM